MRPRNGLYVPTSHVIQKAWPINGLYLPAKQAVQEAWPMLLKVPEEQARQLTKYLLPLNGL